MAKNQFDDALKKLCAHRGVHNATERNDLEPFVENTIEAYIEAYKLVDVAECDVHLLRDQTIVLAHDNNLFRVSEVSRRFEKLSESAALLALELSDEIVGEIEKQKLEPNVKEFRNLLDKSSTLMQLWRDSLCDAQQFEGFSELKCEQLQLLLAMAPLQELTFLQVSRVILKRSACAPTLAEVLELVTERGCDERHLVIEIKPGNSQIVLPMLHLLDEMNAWGNVSLMSFDSFLMKEIVEVWESPGWSQRINAPLRTFLLICSYPYPEILEYNLFQFKDASSLEYLIAELELVGTTGVYLEFHEASVTRSVIKGLRQAGFDVGIWSSRPEHDTIETVRFLSESGAQLINTDDPKKLLKSQVL